MQLVTRDDRKSYGLLNNTIITMTLISVGIAGVAGFNPPPSSCLQTHIFCVKLGFKFQSLYKISNISTSDPSSFRLLPTLTLNDLVYQYLDLTSKSTALADARSVSDS